mmetsp:Transcript_7358/g.13041  ORF Transcript_7358/g.13041 Transcript_7358/m.13041 type:complete len:252 (-) Transcript_7358:205-960(-)
MPALVGSGISTRLQQSTQDGDEVWDESSETDREGECDSDEGSPRAAEPQRPSPSCPCTAPTQAKLAPLKVPPRLACKAAAEVKQQSLVPQTFQQRDGQQGGLMTLVAHLRKENAKLREALVEAQREAEALASQQAQASELTSGKDIDFGHLLSLVRDFNCDGSEGADDSQSDIATGAAQTFHISSPRSETDSTTCSIEQTEASQLREELAAARAEIEDLHIALACQKENGASRAWEVEDVSCQLSEVDEEV